MLVTKCTSTDTGQQSTQMRILLTLLVKTRFNKTRFFPLLSSVLACCLNVLQSPYHVQMGMLLVVLDEYLQEQQALQQA